ncbi:MAG: suppressor of fused domain protein [Alphaproteobacteria bacterium]|nr:suppressor of fused domain protein [Alphaproteobacteria bacterium]
MGKLALVVGCLLILFKLLTGGSFFKSNTDVDPDEDTAPGWDAIDEAFAKIYPQQKNPLHIATVVPSILGGPDPLDGISIYDGGEFWHFVTYGFSELYTKESKYPEISGYGFELTFKLKKTHIKQDEEYEKFKEFFEKYDEYSEQSEKYKKFFEEHSEHCKEYKELMNVCQTLQTVAKWIFEGYMEPVSAFHYIFPKQNRGIDCKGKSGITGLICVPERLINEISTPHGNVKFIELVGVTTSELNALESKKITVTDLYRRLNSDITDYRRNSVISE